MQIFMVGTTTTIAVVVLSILFGRYFRTIVFNVGSNYVSGFDFFFGCGALSLVILLVYRFTGSIISGAAVALSAALILPMFAARLRIGGIVSRLDWRSIVTAGSFVSAIVAVYLPMTLGAGTWYAPPWVFDAPKHLLAITALAESASWPPINPFFEGGVFAYNYLFYVIPAAMVRASGNPELSFVVFPWMLVATVAASFWITLDVSVQLGVPRSKGWIVILFAT